VSHTRLEWSSTHAALPVRGIEDLVSHLSTLHHAAARPLIVAFSVNHCSVQVGLGSPDCFVQITHDDGYDITMGDASAEGAMEYYLLEDHHTEILRVHAIPFAQACEAAAGFYATQNFLDTVQWEHVTWSRE
jgi:hypothetical protein